MTFPLSEAAAAAVWLALTVAARGALLARGLVSCRAGDWGLAFLLAYTAYTTVLFLGAAVGVPIGPAWYLVAAATTLAGLWAAGRGGVDPARAPRAPWTAVEAVLAGALALYAGVAVMFALYFPVSATDAFSYDGRAKYMLLDRSLDLALYHWPGEGFSAENNIAYPPLFSLGLGLVYALGGWQTKVLTAGFSLAWPLLVFGELRRRLPRAASLGWTLLLALTPEVFSHTAFALLNTPAMALTTAVAVALARFRDTARPGYALLAAAAAAGAAGTRPDALVVVLALAAAAVLVPGGTAATRSRLAAGVGVAAAPLLTWGVWSVYLALVVDPVRMAPFRLHDILGVSRVLAALVDLAPDVRTYGPLFLLYVPALVAGAVLRRGARGAALYHADTLLVLAGLCGLYVFVSLEFGGNPFDVLYSSFKRALFYVVPLAGIAAALSPPFAGLARRGAGWIHAEPAREAS